MNVLDRVNTGIKVLTIHKVQKERLSLLGAQGITKGRLAS